MFSILIYIKKVIYTFDGKAEFSAAITSEIILICWFAAQETFLITVNVENTCLIFLWKMWSFFLDNLMNRKFKRTAFKIENWT